jgi:hypothetical protein
MYTGRTKTILKNLPHLIHPCYLCGEEVDELGGDQTVIQIPDLNPETLHYVTVNRGRLWIHRSCLEIIPLFIAIQYKDKFKKFRLNLISKQGKQKLVKKTSKHESIWYEVDRLL